MLDILADAQREVLARFAASNVLLAFDFDGTLSPIVAQPADACLREETRRLLVAVSNHYPCVIISGRKRDDVSARVEGIFWREVVGNHGLEGTSNHDALRPIVEGWRERLATTLAAEEGLILEDKALSLSIHYRLAPHEDAARTFILRALGSLGDGARIVPGKQVFNVIPKGAPHKGTALRALQARVGAATAIFVGDDVTDEDVFEDAADDGLLSIRVGESADTAAPYFLRDQDAIDALLERLLALRSARG